MSGSGSMATKPVPSVPPKSHCKSGWISSESTGSREDVFVVRTSKLVENLRKWVILIALQFRYTFYIPQTKRLRARKIGLQYKIRKGRKQIWGRFSNPLNSNKIE